MQMKMNYNQNRQTVDKPSLTPTVKLPSACERGKTRAETVFPVSVKTARLGLDQNEKCLPKDKFPPVFVLLWPRI